MLELLLQGRLWIRLKARSFNQAIRNALDAQALIDTAEGAHFEVENILQRSRELLIQGINDTNNSDDRAILAMEGNALLDEIDWLGEATSWAGQKLFDGTGGNDGTYNYNEFSFQVGADTNPSNQISVRLYEIGNDTQIAGLRSLINDVKTNFHHWLMLLTVLWKASEMTGHHLAR